MSGLIREWRFVSNRWVKIEAARNILAFPASLHNGIAYDN